MDLIDNGDSYSVEIEVPGYRSDEISITCQESSRTLTVTVEKTVEKQKAYYSERSYGKMNRSIRLPKDVDYAKDFDASLENGVLCVVLAKKDRAAEKKMIPIRSS